MRKIVAVDAKGERKVIKAERIEIELGGERRLVLELPPEAWGDLSIEAQGESGMPLLNLLPLSSNLLNLRVDVLHDPEADIGLSGEAPRLELAVQKALDDTARALPRPKKSDIRIWAEAALIRDVEVTVRLVGEEEGRELNRIYRDKDYPTNVLTFVYGESEAGVLQGDLVLCVPVVAREAEQQGKPVLAHYAHLVVHGMLHLQGFDHEDEADARIMEDRERELLSRMGYDDPYAERAESAVEAAVNPQPPANE